ncbi:unnamed protein product, partial [Porites lobata]
KIRQENVFQDILERKKAFLDNKINEFKKSRKGIFLKGQNTPGKCVFKLSSTFLLMTDQQIIDVAIPGDARVELKEKEKIDKYQDLAKELRKPWKVKTRVVPIIKWHWLPLNSSSDNALHLPQVPLSLESGHTQATSHCKESNLIPSSSFQSGIWNYRILHALHKLHKKKTRKTSVVQANTKQLNYLMNINSRVVAGLNDDVGTAHSSDSYPETNLQLLFLTKLES